jgi:hypothetical protein
MNKKNVRIYRNKLTWKRKEKKEKEKRRINKVKK